MASGDLLWSFHPYNNEPPASNYATLDTRNLHPVLDFDAATDEFAVFLWTVPPFYSGGSIAVKVYWAATSATSGDGVITSAIETLNAQDMDSDGFASANTATTTCSGTSGVCVETSITHTSGAQMDSIAAGHRSRVKISRDADAAGDTMSGDLELRSVDLYEV